MPKIREIITTFFPGVSPRGLINALVYVGAFGDLETYERDAKEGRMKSFCVKSLNTAKKLNTKYFKKNTVLQQVVKKIQVVHALPEIDASAHISLNRELDEGLALKVSCDSKEFAQLLYDSANALMYDVVGSKQRHNQFELYDKKHKDKKKQTECYSIEEIIVKQLGFDKAAEPPADKKFDQIAILGATYRGMEPRIEQTLDYLSRIKSNKNGIKTIFYLTSPRGLFPFEGEILAEILLKRFINTYKHLIQFQDELLKVIKHVLKNTKSNWTNPKGSGAGVSALEKELIDTINHKFNLEGELTVKRFPSGLNPEHANKFRHIYNKAAEMEGREHLIPAPDSKEGHWPTAHDAVVYAIKQKATQRSIDVSDVEIISILSMPEFRNGKFTVANTEQTLRDLMKVIDEKSSTLVVSDQSGSGLGRRQALTVAHKLSYPCFTVFDAGPNTSLKQALRQLSMILHEYWTTLRLIDASTVKPVLGLFKEKILPQKQEKTAELSTTPLTTTSQAVQGTEQVRRCTNSPS